jgi:hypothetical protein
MLAAPKNSLIRRVDLCGWHRTDSLFPLRAEPLLPLGQVKDEVFNSVLANLGLFPRDFVFCLP